MHREESGPTLALQFGCRSKRWAKAVTHNSDVGAVLDAMRNMREVHMTTARSNTRSGSVHGGTA
jgi:hypothetical protein